ncbi:hypothetical protein L0F63_002341 [Massospora cicadina]|nr:hypothetical protein L0F63_002341 [Massospora cicadina]
MADEMGLGKTVQSVSFLNQVYNRCGIHGPFIIVAPLSTIPHWEREFRGWTKLNAVVYHGNSFSRNLIVETEFYYKDSKGDPLTNRFKFDVLITTYEMLISGLAQLKPIHWRVAIFDEAHRLKNRNSKVLETLRAYKLEHRVLLTGTPLQNSVTELFSLLNFLDPERFPSEADFLSEFGDLKTSAEVTELQNILKPLMLRRFKEDVEKSIPNKEETVIEVELTRVQKGWYRAILEKNFSWIQRGGAKAGEGPSLNNIMMELRKCCNHPFLIKGAEEKIVQEQQVVTSEDYTRSLVEASGKLVLLDKLLPKLKSNGHKVLIFSQMTRVLDLLAEYLNRRAYNAERIDGGVKSQDRQLAIDRFSASPDSFVFLLCTRAGGVGINLTAADTVVIFDSDWNPQNDLQAQARAHRIGQTRPVKIYRLLCANTYERQMFDRANLKLGLDKAVMQKMTASESTSGLSKKEVEQLLKLGAYGALLDDDESNKFCAEDIDHILERRSVVVQHEGHRKGTAFSKASFSTFDDDTDLNDPDFWNKWAEKANLDPSNLVATNPLILDHPRERRKAARFDQPPDDDKDSNYEEEHESEPASDPEDEGLRCYLWRTNERTVLERSLMIYALNDWASVQRSFPKRTVQDVRAAGLQLVLTLMAIPNAIQNAGGVEAAQLEADLHAALAADRVRHDGGQDIDWHKLLLEEMVPYPNANERQIREFRSFLHKAPADYQERFHKKAKGLFLRIQTMYRVCELMVPDNQPCVPPVVRSSNLPAPWWDEAADRDLLIGIKRHGYLQYGLIRDDPDLCFSRLPLADSAKGSLAWPPGMEIGARLRRLITTFFRNLARAEAPEAAPARDRVDSWFPKPTKRFLQCLSSYGVESTTVDLSVRVWDQFRVLSELEQRSDNSLEVLLHCVVASYMHVLDSPEARDVRARNADVLEFGRQLMLVLKPVEVMPSVRFDSPTPEKAKRLIKRIMQMHAFRRVLAEAPNLPELANQTGRLNGFPDWFEPQTHGISFAHAVAMYGIGGYPFIVRDAGLPFLGIVEEDWPKDMYVVKFVERILALNQSSQNARARASRPQPKSTSSSLIRRMGRRRGRKRLVRNSPYSHRQTPIDLGPRPAPVPYRRALLPILPHPRASANHASVLGASPGPAAASTHSTPRKESAKPRHLAVPPQSREASQSTSPTTDTAPQIRGPLATLSESSSLPSSPIPDATLEREDSLSSLSSLPSSAAPPANGVTSSLTSSPLTDCTLSPLRPKDP